MHRKVSKEKYNNYSKKMKKILSLLALAALIATLGSCTKDDEVLTGSISGIVSDYTNANAPIAGATVTISGLSKTTGKDGRYTFTDLNPGQYTVQATASGYETNTRMITVRADQSSNGDIQLTKAGSTNDIEITPQTLTFGTTTSEGAVTILNKGSQSLNFSVSDLPNFVKVSPESGIIAAKSQTTLKVSVPNRSTYTTAMSGVFKISVGNDSYAVSVNLSTNTTVDPGTDPDDPNNPGTGPATTNVTRSLLAYYTFDDETVNNSYRESNHGTMQADGDTGTTPKFVDDTPSGKGKALKLEQRQFVMIPNNMLTNKQAFTICMWIKDFGTGAVFYTLNGNNTGSPSFWVNNTNTFSIYTGYDTQTFNHTLENYQSSNWHMISFTANRTSGLVLFYIDGKLIDSQTGRYIEAAGNRMRIGGILGNFWADPMIVDNVRIHSVTLSAEEIAAIYSEEKK